MSFEMRNLLQIGNYRLERKNLGKGSFGYVELAIHRHFKTQVALKIIDKKKLKDAYSVANLNREPFLMMDLNHPNICRLIELCQSSDIFCIVLEYIPGLSLLDVLHQSLGGKLPENKTREIGCQLIGAISYIHSKKIIHRDLKLENIMLKPNGQVMLIDFGLSIGWCPGQKMNTFCGSPEYAAPELFQRYKYYGPPCDIWSFGVILYVLSIGTFPFLEDSQTSQGRAALAGLVKEGLSTPTHFIKLSSLSVFLRSIIKRCLEINPYKRITSNGILNDLWILKGPHLKWKPNTTGRRTDDERKLEVMTKMIQRLGIQKDVEFISQHIKKSQAGTISGAFRIMRKQLEDEEESINEPSPTASNPSQTLERVFQRNKVPTVKSSSLKKETVSILKKPGGTSRVGLKKSVTFQKRSPTGATQSVSRKFNLSSLTPATKFSSLAKDQDLKTYQRSTKAQQMTKKSSQNEENLRSDGPTRKVPQSSKERPQDAENLCSIGSSLKAPQSSRKRPQNVENSYIKGPISKVPQEIMKPPQNAHHKRGSVITPKVPESTKKPDHLRSLTYKPQGNRNGRYLVSPPKRGRYVIMNSLERNTQMSFSQTPKTKPKRNNMSFQSMKDIIFNTKKRA